MQLMKTRLAFGNAVAILRMLINFDQSATSKQARAKHTHSEPLA